MLVGALSAAMDSDFPTLILGESYVNMTLENIESGDPMAVYKSRGEFGMSLGITINNLFVAFLTFSLGVFYVGSIVVLIRNGIMVGVFQYFFIERGLFWESFLTIWIHGTLEISAIIIAGAAGLTMGKGLIFPGTYRRIQAFQRSARRGIKIMIGIAPIFIIAGFIEGYLTRHTDAPDVLRGLFIILCFLFVVGYFVIYPFIKASIANSTSSPTRIPPDKDEKINFDAIKRSGAIFTDIFTFYRKYRYRITLVALSAALLYCLSVFLVSNQSPTELFFFPAYSFSTANSLGQFLYSNETWLIPLTSILSFSIFAYFLLRWIRTESQKSNAALSNSFIDALKVGLGITVIHLLFMTNAWDNGVRAVFGVVVYNFLLVLFILPILLIWLYTMFIEYKNPFSAFYRTMQFVRQRYSIVIGLSFALTLLCYLFLAIADSMLLFFFLDLVSWVIHLEQEQMDQF